MEKTLSEKVKKARLLLNDEVNTNVNDELLAFNFDLIESQVLAYCKRVDFPLGLMLLVIQMVAEYTQANYYRQKETDKANDPDSSRSIASVTRGDTTISYGDNARVTEYGSPANLALDPESFVNNYTDRIRQFRKVRFL